MQRLPFHRIQRAHELGEIGVEEYPALAGLGAGDEAAFGARAHLFRMHVQEGGRLIEAERPYRAAGRFALYRERWRVGRQRNLLLRLEQRPWVRRAVQGVVHFSGKHIRRPFRYAARGLLRDRQLTMARSSAIQ